MDQKWLELLKELMEIPRIKNRVLELNLTNEEALQALPILLEMSEEKDNTKSLYLTSFDRSDSGQIRKVLVLSKEGKRKEYLEHVLTQQFYSIDFEEDKDYQKLDERKVLVNEFAKLLKEDQIDLVSKGFYIYGPHGSGKTFTLKRFARSLAERGRKVGFINTSILVSLFQTIFSKASTEETKEEIIGLLQKVDYLFIDDIGGESISSWFRDDILFQILAVRFANQKGTFFSSNYSLEQLQRIEAKTAKEKYMDNEKSDRLITRIKTLAIPIELKGKPSN